MVHFPRVERHDRFRGRHVDRRKVARAAPSGETVSVTAAGSGPALLGTEDTTPPRCGRVPAAAGHIDWAGLLAVPSDRRPLLGGALLRPGSNSGVSGDRVGTPSDPS